MARYPLISTLQLADKTFSLLLFAVLVRATTSTTSNVAITRSLLISYSPLHILDSLKRWPTSWLMVSLCLACGIGSYAWRRRDDRSKTDDTSKKIWRSDRAENPPLLKKHSSIKSYSTSTYTYSAIRTFHHPHHQADKLPKEPGPLPLLVFIHGLGGSVAQFGALLGTLVHVGPCLGIDLPGCGLSELSPEDWNAYTHESLVELLETIIQQVCDATECQEVILIGHSMGCSLSVSLALSDKRPQEGAFHVRGIIAICPKVSHIPLEQARIFRRLLSLPSPIFNAWRNWDQRGGIASASVIRFVGKEAHDDTKKLQLRFNQQSRTETFRRMARGALPLSAVQRGLPGPEAWSQLSVPLFVVAGESDAVTSPKEISIIITALGRDQKDAGLSSELGARPRTVSTSGNSGSTLVSGSNTIEEGNKKRGLVLKTTILPAPASHGLIYDLATYRTLSGLIQDFLASHIDHRLSQGWQLQRLKESNKWDVKNLAKWQAVNPVSEPIAGVFYALKTLREVDEVHSPTAFTNKWSTKIKAVIDISHETPVYNPHGLEAGGIEYHKHPTVSKIPPTVDEVRDFISLVDQLRDVGYPLQTSQEDSRLIGVHCHYGFNRTGFFICTYLIERLGYSVQGAVDEFQKSRPPGIRHEHFLDTLFVRYCVGLKRAPTL